jgi:hypothetical protein
MRTRGWAAALLVICGLALSGCATSAGEARPGGEQPAKVEAVAGSEAQKVILTEQAVTRLGLRTGAVAAKTVPGAGGKTATRMTVPYSALLYDIKGDTWVFEVVGPRTYLRKKIDVETVDGETVVMASGPAAGTMVVTVGAAVLLGTELGTGGE